MNPIGFIFLAAAFGLVASQTTTGCLETRDNVCRTPCPGSQGPFSCPTGTTTEIRVINNNGDAFCTCVRPYPEDELKELDNNKCASYISQCLTNENYVEACGLASEVCSQDSMVEMCRLAVKNGDTWVYETCLRDLPLNELKDYLKNNVEAARELVGNLQPSRLVGGLLGELREALG